MSSVVPSEVDLPPQDAEHLRMLWIAHYVVAGISAALGLLSGPFYIMFGSMLTAGMKDGAPLMTFMAMSGMILMVFWIVVALLLAAAGYFIRERKNWMFVFVVDCLMCMNAPLGTVLGAFSIVVLTRAPVRRAFGETVA